MRHHSLRILTATRGLRHFDVAVHRVEHRPRLLFRRPRGGRDLIRLLEGQQHVLAREGRQAPDVVLENVRVVDALAGAIDIGESKHVVAVDVGPMRAQARIQRADQARLADIALGNDLLVVGCVIA